jgi:hypothetical protein
MPVRQSQGADLQQLLAESEQFYGQAHFRYRSFIEAVDTEPPPVDVAAFEEVRAAVADVCTLPPLPLPPSPARVQEAPNTSPCTHHTALHTQDAVRRAQNACDPGHFWQMYRRMQKVGLSATALHTTP